MKWIWAIIFCSLISCKHYKPYENSLILGNDGSDALTEAYIKPYKDSLDKYMNAVIGEFHVDMKRIRTDPETVLGNFVADLSLQLAAKMVLSDSFPFKTVDMALLNFGGLRTSLSKGEITRGDIFELMPFENNLVVIPMQKEDMTKLFMYLAAAGGQPIANAKLNIVDSKAHSYTVDGKNLTSKTYYVVTSDYLANGGDNMLFFKDKTQYPLIKLRDAIMMTVENSTSPITSVLTQRITIGK